MLEAAGKGVRFKALAVDPREFPSRQEGPVLAAHHARGDEPAPVQDVDEPPPGHALTPRCAVRIYSRMAREHSSRKIIKRLKREGWALLRTNGSHHVFGKDTRRLSIPHPKKDLPVGLVQEIEEAAGWKDR